MAVAEEKQGAAHDSNNAVNSVSESTTPKTPTGGNSGGASAEFEPPLACVRRMLKNTLPSSTNVGKDASTAFSRACGIFVIYLTACANDYARESKRQTITAADILAAVKELDFDEFTPQLTEFLENHRKLEKRKRELKKSNEESAKKKRKESVEASDDDEDDDEQSQANDEAPIKKQKLDQTMEEEDELDESIEMEAPAKSKHNNDYESDSDE